MLLLNGDLKTCTKSSAIGRLLWVFRPSRTSKPDTMSQAYKRGHADRFPGGADANRSRSAPSSRSLVAPNNQCQQSMHMHLSLTYNAHRRAGSGLAFRNFDRRTRWWARRRELIIVGAAVALMSHAILIVNVEYGKTHITGLDIRWRFRGELETESECDSKVSRSRLHRTSEMWHD